MQARTATPWVIVVLAGLLAAADVWLFRGDPRSRAFADEPAIEVTEGTDAGPGSLREALFRAAGQSRRSEILFKTPVVTLRTPLPTLSNPRGVVLRCESPSCTVDASELVSGPALHINAVNSRVDGIEVVGAKGAALFIGASNVALQRMRFRRNENGVQIAEGSTAIAISESFFVDNAVGVRLDGDASRVVLRSNVFENHSISGIWAVAPTQSSGFAGDAVVILDNRFLSNEIGALLIHLPSRVEDNQFSGSRDAGLYLGGSRNAVLRNRMVGGRANGLLADAVWSSSITDNEIGDNASIGVLMKSGGSNRINDNRVYGNGFGIAVLHTTTSEPTIVSDNLFFDQRHDAVWVYDGSPILRQNRMVQNVGAGIRIVERELERQPGTQETLLFETNHLEQNGTPFVRELYSGPAP